MVTVVVRELGPSWRRCCPGEGRRGQCCRVGHGAGLGEVEALEALGIDPIHYLVVPRLIGIALSVFSLTVYFIFFALLSGYLFAFLEGVPILPGDYFRQLAGALIWQDFALIILKTLLSAL